MGLFIILKQLRMGRNWHSNDTNMRAWDGKEEQGRWWQSGMMTYVAVHPSASICSNATHFPYALFLKPEYSASSSQGICSHVLGTGSIYPEEGLLDERQFCLPSEETRTASHSSCTSCSPTAGYTGCRFSVLTLRAVVSLITILMAVRSIWSITSDFASQV